MKVRSAVLRRLSWVTQTGACRNGANRGIHFNFSWQNCHKKGIRDKFRLLIPGHDITWRMSLVQWKKEKISMYIS
jgi:hypothetical protein